MTPLDSGPRLVDHVASLAQREPDAVALWDGHAGAAEPTPLTRAELGRLTGRLVAAFREAGVSDGDAVAVWLPNWSSAVAAQLAASALGAHVIGVNTRYNAHEVAHVLDGARPRAVLIAHDFNGLDLSQRLAAALQNSAEGRGGSVGDEAEPSSSSFTLLVVAAPGEPAPGDVSGYVVPGLTAERVRAVDLVAGPEEPIEDASLDPHRLGTAFTTSGSTGRPKLAAHTEAAAVAHSLAAGERMGFTSRDAFLGALPLSGVFGFNASWAALLAGTPVLLEPVFSATGVVADMVAVGVTHVVGADDLIGRIAQGWEQTSPAWALRWVGYADFEGRSAELAEWAEREFGAATVGVYGSSELFALTTFWNDDDPLEWRRSGGGRLTLPEAELRVADPVTGDAMPDGQEGEIQFRGPNVVDTYLGDTDGRIAQAAFTDDGWFHSGDLGVLVAPRAVRYVCRMGDVLRLRGFLVDPAEVEQRLLAHEQVRTAKVVGVNPGDGATVAVGFVVPMPGGDPDPEELRRWCGEALATFKVPTRIVVVQEMPVTSGTNGTKIRAAALREEALRLLDTQA